MISRTTLFVDRLATLLLALVLVAGGTLGVWWWTGNSPLAGVTDTTSITDLVDTGWWPWASAGAGVLLVLIGLRWLAVHVRSTRVKHLYLRGSGSAGKLDVDGSKVAGAAATAFADTLGVRDAKGSVRRRRGQLVGNLTATIEPEADLALIAESADRVAAQLAQVLGRDDLRCSIELRVAARGRSLPRVS
ncbi:MAG: hypothetical protein ABI873_04235 [Marmoricola sp.]